MKFFKLDEVEALRIANEGLHGLTSSDPSIEDLLQRSPAVESDELIEAVTKVCRSAGLLFVYDEWVGDAQGLEGPDDEPYPTFLLEDWIVLARQTYNRT
jgi:hypothetical protein